MKMQTGASSINISPKKVDVKANSDRNILKPTKEKIR